MLARRLVTTAWKLGTGREIPAEDVAGYVDGRQGERWVVVAIINHPQAQAARGALESLVEWVGRQP